MEYSFSNGVIRAGVSVCTFSVAIILAEAIHPLPILVELLLGGALLMLVEYLMAKYM